MKKILLLILVCSLSSTALAQGEVTGAKHSVATNSFWANWFVQANVVGSSFWSHTMFCTRHFTLSQYSR